MTQEQKDLLLKDLCARLPYGVWIERKIKSCKFSAKCMLDAHGISAIERERYEFCKPYLFPLSSMTEEQEEEFKNLYYRFHESAFIFNERFSYDRYNIKDIGFYPCYLQDWLNKNHFDYRGLIPMGLANDATGLNIY